MPNGLGTRGSTRGGFIAGALAAAAAVRGGAASAADAFAVRIEYFAGVSALPILTGIARGTFAREGLTVSATAASTSADLFGKLDGGALDLAHTAIGNPIAYDAGAGAPGIASRDFVAIGGIDDGLLRLVARPGITTIAGLKGKTLAVDALATGYAFALRGMLESAGVHEFDVTFVAKGATQQRAQGLLAGAFDATLVTPPFDLDANARGFATLGRATDLLGAYQGIAIVGRRRWLEAHRDIAERYLRAYRAATAQAANDRAGSIALLTASLNVSTAIAGGSFDAAFAPDAGLRRDATLNVHGIRTVLRLRARYGPPGAGDDPARYIDESFLAAASR
jgi:ABC-type nitrate/sulfonate/bicarbonate transport system substrate-binding protein